MDKRDQVRVVRMKVLLLVASLVCLAYLFVAAYEENFTAEWRSDQRQYARLLADESNPPQARDYPIEMRQVYLEDRGVVDRCVTCHVGIDNPNMKVQPQPLTVHSGNVLKYHPPDRFGCTICHQGQGRATEKNAAHGRVPYWTEPLLIGDFVQATCAKCHHEEQVPQAAMLNRGRRLMADLGCVGCHQAGDVTIYEKAGPRLTATGSKVSRTWLVKWLSNPKDYLPHGKMPQYGLRPAEVDALSAYLTTFRDQSIDSLPAPEGDHDAGANVYRESQCIVCHVTKEDYAGNPVGGDIGPDLRKLANKVNKRWLVAFFRDPHAFLPHTKMPQYNFGEKMAVDLAQFAYEEWMDVALRDVEQKAPAPPAPTPSQIEAGKRLFTELDCAGCHELTPEDKKPDAPNLTYIGSTAVDQLTFGDAQVRHTLPDYLFTKLKRPRSLWQSFALPPGKSFSEMIWHNLRPAALFSAAIRLPEGSESDRLAWIFKQTQEAGMLDAKLSMPAVGLRAQADWLVGALNDNQTLSSLKMPDFQLSDEDAAALTIALMSLSKAVAPSKQFEVQPKPKAIFDPQDEFGQLVRRYRCTSCHKIRESGQLLASDLTVEGNRVNRQWLYHYLNNPYSMRRMLTIAMPIFHFRDEESRLMADYMSEVLVNADIGAGWKQGRGIADVTRGEKLFREKGCLACHQLLGTGGDVGPSLTTQVPEFPQGTWAGDKLRPEWIYAWLKDPQALLPDTIEPNVGLTEQEVLDLTSFVSSLRSPEFQKGQQQP